MQMPEHPWEPKEGEMLVPTVDLADVKAAWKVYRGSTVCQQPSGDRFFCVRASLQPPRAHHCCLSPRINVEIPVSQC